MIAFNITFTLPFSTRFPLHLILPFICISTPMTLEEGEDLLSLSESLENIALIL